MMLTSSSGPDFITNMGQIHLLPRRKDRGLSAAKCVVEGSFQLEKVHVVDYRNSDVRSGVVLGAF